MTNSKSSTGLLEAFRVFDKEDTGSISVWYFEHVTGWDWVDNMVQVYELKRIMTKLGGDTYSEEEFDTMVKYFVKCLSS